MGQAIILNKNTSYFIEPFTYSKQYDSNSTDFIAGEIENEIQLDLNKQYVVSCSCYFEREYDSASYYIEHIEGSIIDGVFNKSSYEYIDFKLLLQSVTNDSRRFIKMNLDNNKLTFLNFENYPQYYASPYKKLQLQYCYIDIVSIQGKALEI